jgi:hypothetical protein
MQLQCKKRTTQVSIDRLESPPQALAVGIYVHPKRSHLIPRRGSQFGWRQQGSGQLRMEADL